MQGNTVLKISERAQSEENVKVDIVLLYKDRAIAN